TAAFSQLQAVLERCLPRCNEPLTPRQQEIYGLIGQGLSNKEIAKATELSIATVETHRKAIAQKLGMSGAELVRQASLLGRLNLEHLRSSS
ncbi:response regulator transcription factor, partial [Vulcanococcus sp.]|uniref:response regulator transcription factor n=1 Tax=Vulcanococcus sp. TaxID=2856995 RepID=UPI003F6A533F